jgi:hypothetical protein
MFKRSFAPNTDEETKVGNAIPAAADWIKARRVVWRVMIENSSSQS